MSTPTDKTVTVADFVEILNQNPGGVVLKLTAEWCGPCKRIAPDVDQWMARLPENIQTVIVDIDDSIELYAKLKTKRLIAGIPALLFWKKSSKFETPDNVMIKSVKQEVDSFFEYIFAYSREITPKEHNQTRNTTTA
jgi:thiol-disulfide isomerase/thioredoxin